MVIDFDSAGRAQAPVAGATGPNRPEGRGAAPGASTGISGPQTGLRPLTQLQGPAKWAAGLLATTVVLLVLAELPATAELGAALAVAIALSVSLAMGPRAIAAVTGG